MSGKSEVSAVLVCAALLFGCDSKQASLPQFGRSSVVTPAGPQSIQELYVVDSIPVGAGSSVDIVSIGPPRSLLVSKASILEVRWKVPGPFQSPKYPATGFIKLSLAANQWDAIEHGGQAAVQPSNPGTP